MILYLLEDIKYYNSNIYIKIIKYIKFYIHNNLGFNWREEPIKKVSKIYLNNMLIEIKNLNQ